ncbi:hypothetical protein GCM10011494_33020 [Novosphingobium endophyticum]|uniref:Core-binding (CB) domain-containing protein n=1 Tax=Novosphingobium endophyticum TaxID=1955250 RepID=A0A916TV61_9SPHN|nr:hypothetical protein GCM10011494_33020 [Novosphingobium endophyticum]
MIEDMNLHRLSRATQRNYLRDVSRFATWLGRPPDTATDEDLRRYQIEQTETGIGALCWLLRGDRGHGKPLLPLNLSNIENRKNSPPP